MGRPKAATLTLHCEICSGEFTTPDTIRGRKKVTCSKSCASKKAYSSQVAKADCKFCGKTTKTAFSVINAGLPIYCSECSTHRYLNNCETCSKEFRSKKRDNRFCSRECTTEYLRSDLVQVRCFYCGLEFEQASFSVYSGKRVFCSKRCGSNQYSVDHPSRYGGTWTTWIRRIKERDGNQCVKCGSEEELEVHHFLKLLAFDNPNDAHYYENLVLLCKKCHDEVEDEGIKDLDDFYRRYSPTR